MAKKYKLVIQSMSVDAHLPTLVGPNGKAMFNEAVNRRGKIIAAWERFAEAVRKGMVEVVYIDKPAGGKKWPKNAGGKKAAKKAPKKR